VTASSFSYPAFEAFRDRSTTLVTTFAWAELRRASLSVGGEAELAAAQLVSGGYYSGLGVPAILGRTITPEDDRPGGEIAAVISHGYWQRRFGGAADVIGRRGTLTAGLHDRWRLPRGFSGTLPVGRSADVGAFAAWRPESYTVEPACTGCSDGGGSRGHSAQAERRWCRGSPLRPPVAPRRAAAAPEGGSQGLTRRRHEQRQPLAVPPR
jgi:hypothetical protein